MFNPAQIKGWRKQLEIAPDLDNFDGYHFETVQISLGENRVGPPPQFFGRLHSPARIFGVPHYPSCLLGIEDGPISGPTGRLVTLSGGRVIGFTSALSEDRRLYAPDEVSAETIPSVLIQNSTDHEGFLLTKVGEELIARFAARQLPRLIPLNALFMRNIEPGNYGSFLFRQLPQMICAHADGLAFDCYIAERTPWFREAADLLGLPPRPVFSPREVSGEFFKSLLFYTHSDAEGFLRPEVRCGVEGLIRSSAKAGRSYGPQPLYISRSLSTLARPSYRPMLNEHAIEELASRRGFRVVYPETLSFPDQVATFASCTAVIGPSGSGMLNAIFAPPQARMVDFETYTTTVRQHAKLYASSGHEYGFAFCPIEDNDDRPAFLRSWRLPEHLFEEAAEWACK